MWAFCYAKARNVPEKHQGDWGYGDVWTWTVIDPDTKLIPSWLVGWRGEPEAGLPLGLAGAVANRIQLIIDGQSASRLRT